jgi:hypothetical protein
MSRRQPSNRPPRASGPTVPSLPLRRLRADPERPATSRHVVDYTMTPPDLPPDAHVPGDIYTEQDHIDYFDYLVHQIHTFGISPSDRTRLNEVPPSLLPVNLYRLTTEQLGQLYLMLLDILDERATRPNASYDTVRTLDPLGSGEAAIYQCIHQVQCMAFRRLIDSLYETGNPPPPAFLPFSR